ncbi:MAG: HEAT repeat domain-containing protein, partial [Deltaproteobacteria bacterium]|nr:HEAT repeat domain-containing protein [Deltaproteobacteria bacterium]
LATKVRRRCEDLLFDKDFRVQAAAIEALGTLGDTSAISSLEDIAARDLDGRLRRRAREVIRDLREGQQQSDELKTLRSELDTMRTTVAKLSERLEQLEA